MHGSATVPERELVYRPARRQDQHRATTTNSVHIAACSTAISKVRPPQRRASAEMVWGKDLKRQPVAQPPPITLRAKKTRKFALVAVSSLWPPLGLATVPISQHG